MVFVHAEAFSAIKLSESTRQEFREQALRNIELLVDSYAEDGGIVSWDIASDAKYGMPMRKGYMPGNSTPCYQTWTKFEGELKELCSLTFAATTEKFRREMRLLYGKQFLDCRVLDVVIPRQSDGSGGKIGMTLKWYCLKSASSFARPRDFVVLEYARYFRKEGGDLALCRVTKSVEIQGMPSFRSLGIVRGKIISSIEMFSAAKGEGMFDVSHTVHVDLKETTTLAKHLAEKQMVENVRSLGTYILRKRVTNLSNQAAKSSNRTRRYDRTACEVCWKSFWAGRKKYTCCACLLSICKDCSITIDGLHPSVTRSLVCFRCLAELKKGRKGNVSTKDRPSSQIKGVDAGPSATRTTMKMNDNFMMKNLSRIVPVKYMSYKNRNWQEDGSTERTIGSSASDLSKEGIFDEIVLKPTSCWSPHAFMSAAKTNRSVETSKHFAFEVKKRRDPEEDLRADTRSSTDSGSWVGDELEMDSFDISLERYSSCMRLDPAEIEELSLLEGRHTLA